MLKDNNELAVLFAADLKERGIEADLPFIAQVTELVKERVNFVSELWEQAAFFFEAPVEYDAKVVKKRWKGDVPAFMSDLTAELEKVADWKADDIKAVISAQIEAKGLGFGLVMNAFRLALVGGGFGPDLMTIAEMIGKEETIKRLQAAVKNIGA